MEVVEGKVKKYTSVTKNRVQFELVAKDGVFELFIDQSWVMDVGDVLVIAGQKDKTGKFYAYAYSNQSKNVRGWNYVNYFSLAFLVGMAVFGFLVYFTLASVFMRSNTSALIFIAIGLVAVYFFLRNPLSESLMYLKSKSAICS
ncbi:hypothetical protein [Halioxenophilus aromaticivorans]|uniref:Uncharacterized protein n=1 Tax=Halioxenophilus aromaticivorans TaxID=1306992 RepID=A0AAV3U066_9ALTE